MTPDMIRKLQGSMFKVNCIIPEGQFVLQPDSDKKQHNTTSTRNRIKDKVRVTSGCLKNNYNRDKLVI